MGNLLKGLVAGFVATLVLSALMVMKAKMGIMPELDLPKMIAGMMGKPDEPMIGWAIHFMIGVILYGVAIAVFGGKRPGDSPVGRGMMIAVVGWLIMMIMLMPMAGAGMFAMKMSIMAPVMTLVLHLIFGAVLGWTYGRLQNETVPVAAIHRDTRA